MNKKQKSLNNKGFSLVELIIVIAIMAVLVGVLAPQFIKYVEQARRGKDIQAANSFQTAYLADIADGTITTDCTNAKIVSGTPGTDEIALPTTVSEVPALQGNVTGADAFYVTIDASAGTVSVSLDSAGSTYVVTTETGAQAYKNAN